jgi:primosomal protein N'
MRTFASKDEALVEKTATEGALRLAKAPGLDVLPAMPTPMERREDTWRWQVYIRTASTKQIVHACRVVFPNEMRYSDALKIQLDIDAVFLG